MHDVVDPVDGPVGDLRVRQIADEELNTGEMAQVLAPSARQVVDDANALPPRDQLLADV